MLSLRRFPLTGVGRGVGSGAEGFRALPMPESWLSIDQPALKQAHVIIFDPDGSCVSGPVGCITYNSVTGLAKR